MRKSKLIGAFRMPKKRDEIMPTPMESSDSSSTEGDLCMKKQLGLLDGVGMIVGIIVGSGIFISPTGVIQYTGSVGMSLIVWALSGLITLIGALCYAELGTMIPKSGGEYAYIMEAFGDIPGFVFLWVAIIIVLPTSNAVVALTFANYILQPVFPHCSHPPEVAVKIVGALVISFITWTNCTNVKLATKIQDFFTIAKVFVLVVIIATGFFYLSTGHVENYQDPFKNTNWGPAPLATAFYQGFFSFAGWNYLNFVVEEIKEPYINLPKAIWISLPLVTIVYFLTNVAYFTILTSHEVLASSAVAVTFGNRTLGTMAWIIPFFVACSTFGSLNGSMFASSRIFFVGGREGHLPHCLAFLNTESLTPVPALVFMGFMTIIMTLPSNIQSLINYLSFAEALFILIAVTALLWLRVVQPHAHRPIKVWLGLPIIFMFVCFFLVVLPIIENPLELGIASAVILSGVPAYFFFVAWNNKPRFWNRTLERCYLSIMGATGSLPAGIQMNNGHHLVSNLDEEDF